MKARGGHVCEMDMMDIYYQGDEMSIYDQSNVMKGDEMSIYDQSNVMNL